MLDLTHMNDSNLDEGYGGVTGDRKASSNLTNLTMIRRFNHHSTMVLKACDSQTSKQAQNSTINGTAPLAGPSASPPNKNSNNSGGVHLVNGHVNSNSDDHASEPVRKRAKIREKVTYVDLQDKNKTKNVNLMLHKMDGYLHGPTPATLSRYTHGEDAIVASQAVTQEVEHWSPDLSSVCYILILYLAIIELIHIYGRGRAGVETFN